MSGGAQELSIGMMVVKMAFGLGVVIGLMWLLVYFLRRFAPNGKTHGNLRILEYRSLGGRRSVALVQAFDRVFLIGVSDHSVQPIAEWNDLSKIPETFADTPQPSLPFEKFLKRSKT